VIKSHEAQVQRFTRQKELSANADMKSMDILEYCSLDTAGRLVKIAITTIGLSGRAYNRTLKAGRPIA
jgi:magnesium chelatase family protein